MVDIRDVAQKRWPLLGQVLRMHCVSVCLSLGLDSIVVKKEMGHVRCDHIQATAAVVLSIALGCDADLPTSHNPSHTVPIAMSTLTGPTEPSDSPLHICPFRIPRDTHIANIVDV